MPLYSSAISGINAAIDRYNVSANNRANISTSGFKKSRALLATSPSNSGVITASIQRMHSQGSLILTNHSLDIAIDGKGFFQISLDNNGKAYTRDGTFQLDNQGRIVTTRGKPLYPEITVPANVEKISMDTSGNIRALINGNWQDLGQVELAYFQNPGGLTSIGNNLFVETIDSGIPLTGIPDSGGFGKIIQGSLESSNVNLAEEAVSDVITKTMVGANIAALKTEDEMLGALIDLFV